MKNIVDRIGLPALLEQTAEECTELAHACLKEARRLRGENPTPKTTPECWLAISGPQSSYAGANGWTTINQEETGREEKEMTRKRFKKPLMSERFDRNEANFWADYYNMMGTSYAEAYEDMKPYLRSRLISWNGNRAFKDFRSMVLDCTSTIFLSLADEMERMREVFRELGNALREVNT